MHTDDTELLDLVNEKDEIVGTILRRDMMSLKTTPDRYIRCIEVFIQRSDGAILLPRRSATKKIAPGGFDLSASGHLASGETYEQACIREVKEEVGITVSPRELILLSKEPPTPRMFYFRNVYLIQTDQLPVLGSEHTELSWIQPNKLQESVEEDVPAKDTLYDDIPILLTHLGIDSHL